MLALPVPCLRQSLPALLFSRSFHSTPNAAVSYRARKGLVSQIRTPSKRAMAAKIKRKAAAAAAKDTSTRLTLQDAIGVLKAISIPSPRASTVSLLVKTKLGTGVAVPRGRYKLPKEATNAAEDIVCVFAEGRQADDAKRAGAHIVGGIELIEGIVSNRIRATTFLCTTGLIKAITPRLGRVLGPKGLMPSERRGTVTDDVGGYIRKLVGTTEWKADKQGVIRLPIAKTDWTAEDVVKNFEHVMTSVKRATGNLSVKEGGKASVGSHSAPITKVMLSATQGPGVRISNF
ncbi:ribosomal protein L1-like protein [Armillaria fumosa]|nr:ribosomal protein L1-like protein [Armillaria fumosa]